MIPRCPEELEAAFEKHSFQATREVSAALWQAERQAVPLLLEGPPGPGKSELARLWAEVCQAPLIRLQCHRDLDETRALFEWSRALRLLAPRLLASRAGAWLSPSVAEGLRALWGQADALLSRESPTLPSNLASALRVVLLIDRVDQADEAFDDFLAQMLSDWQVSAPEGHTPVPVPRVILTSDSSRELSEGLRRRCLCVQAGLVGRSGP